MFRRMLCLAVPLLCAPILGQSATVADELPADMGAIVSLQTDNDGVLFDRDTRGYAHGERANYTFAKNDEPAWLHSLVSWAPFGYKSRRYSLTAGRTAFAPVNGSGIVRPSASLYYVGAGLSGQGSGKTDLLQIQVGVIEGKSPNGMNVSPYRFKTEPTILIQHTRLWTGENGAVFGNKFWDLTPHSTISLGTTSTYIGAGAMFRLGNAIFRENAALPALQPNSVVHDRFRIEPKLGINLVAGFEARAVARDTFLDGNMFRGNTGIDKKWYTGHGFVGIVMYKQSWKLAAYYVKRAREFRGQEQRSSYGSMSLTKHF